VSNLIHVDMHVGDHDLLQFNFGSFPQELPEKNSVFIRDWRKYSANNIKLVYSKNKITLDPNKVYDVNNLYDLIERVLLECFYKLCPLVKVKIKEIKETYSQISLNLKENVQSCLKNSSEQITLKLLKNVEIWIRR